MSIEILYPNGKAESRAAISFTEIQEIVGGYVEVVSVREKGKVIQGCCNENGKMLGQKYNHAATIRFKLFGDCVGSWVILSGKDKLR